MKALRLLIVEDSKDDTILLLNELKQSGFNPLYTRVETAEDFKKALGDSQWDLVLSDYDLPTLSAPEALEILRNSGREIPLIIVSGVIDEKTAISAMKAGARDYIMKDNLAKLVPIVERTLRESGIRDERRKMGESLKESEDRFRRLAENARDIIYRVRMVPDKFFDYVSPSAERIIGYSPGEHYAQPDLAEKIIHPGDRHLLEALFRGDPVPEPLVMRWYHKNGSLLWIEQRNVCICDEQGNLEAVEGIARDITDRVLNEQQLKTHHAQVEALSSRILNAMEEERSRLARELHDELGQALTAVKLDLQLLGDQLSSFQDLKQKLSQTIELVDYTINLVRRQSVSLRPPALDDMGLLPAIEDMVRGFMNRTGIKTHIESNGFFRRLPRPIETALYRCVQESLTNVARHARAKNVSIRIKQDNGHILVRVKDDGVGFDPEKQSISSDSIGLTGMQERVKLLSGQFSIDSSSGQGTSIMIRVPWKKQQNRESLQ